MFGLSPAHLVIILVIALVVIGPGKLPEVGAAIGKSIREFQKATGQAQEPTQPTQAAAPMQPMPPAQSYYAAQPAYGAPVYPPQQPQYAAPAYPAYPVQPAPMDPAAVAPVAPQPAPISNDQPPAGPSNG